jgi:hypothetical protein
VDGDNETAGGEGGLKNNIQLAVVGFVLVGGDDLGSLRY